MTTFPCTNMAALLTHNQGLAATSNDIYGFYIAMMGDTDFEDTQSKVLRKVKENPFVPAGMAGFFAIVAYQLYKMKSRGDMKMSVHLIHTRVAAQTFAVGSMTLGVIYSMYRQYVKKPDEAVQQTTLEEK